MAGLSLLLLLIDALTVPRLVGVADLRSFVGLMVGVPLPKAALPAMAARLGTVDAILMIIGALASLVYLAKRGPGCGGSLLRLGRLRSQ